MYTEFEDYQMCASLAWFIIHDGKEYEVITFQIATTSPISHESFQRVSLAAKDIKFRVLTVSMLR